MLVPATRTLRAHVAPSSLPCSSRTSGSSSISSRTSRRAAAQQQQQQQRAAAAMRPSPLDAAPAAAAPASPSAAGAAAAPPSLLRTHLAAPPEALAPLLEEAAARQGPLGRVYVHVEGAGGRPGAALLEWLARLYRAVADLAPRLDVVPLLPFAGWDDAALAALPGISSGGGGGGGVVSDGPREVSAAAAASNGQASAAAESITVAAPPPSAGAGPLPPDEPLSFEHVAVGGTFDRLHAGHRLLLAATALAAARRVYVGVTADELLAKKAHREWLQPYEARCAAALGFMRAVRPTLDAEAGALRDPAAPTQAELDPGMEALVVSRETLAGGEAINRGRAARGFAPLRLLVVGVVGERADGSKLSSSELRERDAAAGSSGGGGGGAGDPA